ncbi:MAG TPA: hypothetical protein DDW52_23855 [Planctomycetaceae bacterium]|nr:hypothetical protein [Planctomycetaceae bacterium]
MFQAEGELLDPSDLTCLFESELISFFPMESEASDQLRFGGSISLKASEEEGFATKMEVLIHKMFEIPLEIFDLNAGEEVKHGDVPLLLKRLGGKR